MSDKTTAAALRGQTAEEIEEFISEKKDELFKLRLQHYTQQLEDSAALGRVRRELARALTVQRERFGEGLPAMEQKLSEASFAFYSEQTQAGADALAEARSELVQALTDKGQPEQGASVRVRRRALGKAGAVVAQAKDKAEKAQEAARLAANRAAAKAAKQAKAARKSKEMQA